VLEIALHGIGFAKIQAKTRSPRRLLLQSTWRSDYLQVARQLSPNTNVKALRDGVLLVVGLTKD